MKIIYHSCTDGYLTEVQTEHCRKVFSIMLDAVKFAEKVYGGDIKDVPQERIEHSCSRVEIIKELEGVSYGS